MSHIRVPQVPFDPNAPFPDPAGALRDPDGLLAMGGDLSPPRLLNAYRSGVFPWFSEGQPILWWSPDPRMVFDTAQVRLASKVLRQMRRTGWRVGADTCFAHVLDACADTPRPGQAGTWITPAMRAAYTGLHRLGHAHSIEVMDGGRLVGGLYGVAIGRMFFAESMVSLAPGGSKVALAALALRLRDWGWPLLDAQVDNPHLRTLGARTVPRPEFLERITTLCQFDDGAPGPWTTRFGRVDADALAAARP